MVEAIGQWRQIELAEQYHELALITLSQNLWEAVARSWLSHPNGLPERPASERHKAWWRDFLRALDAVCSDPALRGLAERARTVDVTLVPARDRFIAHPLAGHVTVRGRDGKGTLTTTGRIAWWSSEYRAGAYGELLAINSDLEPAHRSPETNQYELAKDLARRGSFMGPQLRERYRRVTRDLGFELNVVAAGDAMVGMVEALVAWFERVGAPPPARPHTGDTIA